MTYGSHRVIFPSVVGKIHTEFIEDTVRKKAKVIISDE